MKFLVERGTQGLTRGPESIEALSRRIVEAGRKMREFNTTIDCLRPQPDTPAREFEAMRECAVSIGDYLETIVKSVQSYSLPYGGMPILYHITSFDREFFRIVAKTLKEPTAAGLLEGVITFHAIGQAYKSILPKDDTMSCVKKAFMGTVQYLGGSQYNTGQLPSVCRQGLPSFVNDYGRIELPRLPF